jgi:hypothetical protein
MVPSHRRALSARLLSFRYKDGLYLDENSSRRLREQNKVMAGETPANPATLVGIRSSAGP